MQCVTVCCDANHLSNSMRVSARSLLSAAGFVTAAFGVGGSSFSSTFVWFTRSMSMASVGLPTGLADTCELCNEPCDCSCELRSVSPRITNNGGSIGLGVSSLMTSMGALSFESIDPRFDVNTSLVSVTADDTVSHSFSLMMRPLGLLAAVAMLMPLALCLVDVAGCCLSQ